MANAVNGEGTYISTMFLLSQSAEQAELHEISRVEGRKLGGGGARRAHLILSGAQSHFR